MGTGRELRGGGLRLGGAPGACSCTRASAAVNHTFTGICVDKPRMESYEFESMVRGYHVYKDIWEAEEDEILACIKDRRNRHDPYAVAVTKSKTVVGHLPRKISTVCSLFLSTGTITCRVVGTKRYSRDLPQGGLEIPCLIKYPDGKSIQTD